MLMQPLMDTSCYGQQSQTSITTTTTTTSTQRLVQYGSTMAYFFLHYAMMVAYIAQGGTNTMSILFSNDPMMGPAMIGPIAFTTIMAISIYTIPKRIMSLINNILVVGVFVSMGSIVAAGVPTIDPNTLIHIQPSYQNPINVLSSLPIIFLAFVYHNIVPFIVKELQYNVTAIQMAIVIGTSLPFLMFVTWNAIVLGNIDPVTIQSMGGNFDPISVLTMNTNTGTASWLGFSISTFSTLAVITSLIGFTYGLNEAWNDLFNMAGSTNNDTTNQSLVVNDPIDNPSSTSTDVTSSASTQKLLIYTLIFVPPLLIALNNPNIFVPALDYGGTFGVTILFLILPTYILWNLRYSNIEIPTDTSNHMMTPSGRGDEIMLNSKISETTTTTTTIVPGGKIPMIGLWLTAVGLMIDQIMEKFDVHFILPTFSGM
jgi:tyrosine-specific transport protein